jgi:pimeloyl-ACP methyl ester carboxylesterase
MRCFFAGFNAAQHQAGVISLNGAADASSLFSRSRSVPATDLHNSAPTRFLEANGIRFAYRRFGKEGVLPMVCFQHTTGTMNNWDPIHTNRIAEDRPVVLVDYPGVGRSGGETPQTFEHTAQAMIDFVRALGADKADLFGFSIGGMIAQQIALLEPDLVRRLVLVGTAPPGGEGMASYTPKVREIVSRVGSTTEERLLELFFAPTVTSQAAGEAWLARIAERQSDREPLATPAVVQAQLAALQAWGRVSGERYASLDAIPHRSLVVNGHDDIMVPTVNSFIMQQRMPDARLVLFPDSGHGAHFQFPHEFAELLAYFLAAD